MTTLLTHAFPISLGMMAYGYFGSSRFAAICGVTGFFLLVISIIAAAIWSVN